MVSNDKLKGVNGMKYRLLIIWDTGEKEENFYNTEEEAKEIEAGYKMAFGNQIAFTCIDRKGATI